MQRESEAASGASSRLSAGKEDIQDAKTSSSEDNRPPIYDCNWQASDDFLPQSLQIDDDYDEPLAISPNEALTSDWTSELMNSHQDYMDHPHGFNGTDSTKFSYPTWTSWYHIMWISLGLPLEYQQRISLEWPVWVWGRSIRYKLNAEDNIPLKTCACVTRHQRNSLQISVATDVLEQMNTTLQLFLKDHFFFLPCSFVDEVSSKVLQILKQCQWQKFLV